MVGPETAPPQVIAVDAPWLKRANTLAFPELDAFITQGYALANEPNNPIYQGWRMNRRR
jgi:hypothetical protein